MPITRRGTDTSDPPDPVPSPELAAAAARLLTLEEKFDVLSTRVSELQNKVQELSARPTASPLEALAGIKQGDVLNGSSALLRRLTTAPTEADPLATPDSAVRAFRSFDPSTIFKAHVLKPLAAPAIADILLELEAWSVGHEGRLPFHLIRFLSGWSHSLTQISEMPSPTMPLKAQLRHARAHLASPSAVPGCVNGGGLPRSKAISHNAKGVATSYSTTADRIRDVSSLVHDKAGRGEDDGPPSDPQTAVARLLRAVPLLRELAEGGSKDGLVWLLRTRFHALPRTDGLGVRW